MAVQPITHVRMTPVNAAIAMVTVDSRTTDPSATRSNRSVDADELPLADLEELPGGGIRVGAHARMSDVAGAAVVRSRYPGMSQALLFGASEQVGPTASIGGNLFARARCAYFRDGISPCNKREPGSGCAAIDGWNRDHAILGTSEHCIAADASDVAVALVGLDAVVHTVGPRGARVIAIDDFYLLPEGTPDVEHPLDRGELIVAIEIPEIEVAAGSRYSKFRDRQSYEFALISVFAAIEVKNGRVEAVRLAFGGVGTKPWRARRAEARLVGGPATAEAFEAAVGEEFRDAVTRPANAYKLEFATRGAVRALTEALSSNGK